MPRYLGIDYLAEALQQRRNLLSQMLLTIPSHLEYVEVYEHNGAVEKKIQHIPWDKESAFKLSSKQPIDYLSQLTGSIQYPEPYTQERTVDDIVPSSNPDSPLVSFDVWSDLEEEVANYVINSLAPDKEQFTAFNENVDDDSTKDKLEEVENMDYLHNARQQIPKVKDLSSRLKTKLVQDPLVLDREGNPLQEKNALRTELHVPCQGGNNEHLRNRDKERFLKILSNDTLAENDFAVEDKEIENVVSPVIPPEQQLCVEEARRSLELHKDSQPEVANLELLLRETNLDEVETIVNKTVTEPGKTKMERTNFVTLNDEDDAKCSESLEDQQLLESPSHLPNVLVNDDNTNKFISALEKFKLSPNIESPPMTPNKIAQCVQNIWENEKLLFSEHLAMIFPVPSTSTEKRKRRSITLIQMALKKLTLSQECLDGKLELGIPWDPLAVSATAMETCHRNLQRLSVWSDKEEQYEPLKLHKALWHSGEAFHKTSLQEHESSGGLSKEDPSFEIPVERQTGAEKELTMPATDENRHALPPTLNTPKSPPNSILRPSTTTPTVKESVISSEDGSELCIFPCTAPTIMTQTQVSGGLEDFLLLRKGKLDSVKSSNHTQCIPPKKVVKAAKVRPSVFTTDISESDQTTPTKRLKETNDVECRVLQNDISVELSDEFQEVLDELITHVKPLLYKLQDNGVIPQSKTLSTLNPEYTRFVLKQAEMSIRETEKNKEETQMYCMTVCLHALVSSVDILMQSGLEAAIAYLTSTQEKYGSLLGGALESSRRYLFETHFTFQQRKILHPKLSKLLNIVTQWSKAQSDVTAAVFTYAFPQKLNKEIIETLSGVHGVQVNLYTSAEEINGMGNDGKLPVYVVSALAITEDFPWGKFDFVLDYDLNTMMKREELSRSRRLRAHISLRTTAKTLLDNKTALELKGGKPQCQEGQDQFIFIGSEKITENVDLLHLLETSHNVLIYERQYSSFKPRDSLSKMCLQPDVMIDERTCVYLQHLPSLADESEYERLRDTVLSLSLKCLKCCVILYSSKEPEYAFTGDVLRHLSILFASFAHFQKSEFQVEILYTFTVKETAKLIRQIGEETRARSVVWNKLEWTKRKWLTNEASEHEKFLLSLPCINSFSAQVMLTAAPLAELLKMSIEELKETCPWIPQRTLTEFYRTVNWCSELNDKVAAHSFVQSTPQVFQQSNWQMPGYAPSMDKPSPCQMATSNFTSSPDSVVTNVSGPFEAKLEYTDYRHHPDPLIPANNTQESSRNASVDRGYSNYTYEQGIPATATLRNESDLCSPVFTVSQRDYTGTQHFRETLVDECFANDWRSSLKNNGSSAPWEDRVTVDLKRCITGLPDSQHQVTQHSQLRAEQPSFQRDPFSQETYGAAARLRTQDFSKNQLKNFNTEYLANSKEPVIKYPVIPDKTNTSDFRRIAERTTRPPRLSLVEQPLPEQCWGIGSLDQTHVKPDWYSRTGFDLPQADLKRSMERHHSSHMHHTRQPVRVLDLGDENSYALPTKVGIAQPQRRTYGSTGQSKANQVLGENSVASQHKRFSLGIDRSTHPTTKPPSLGASKGEHEVPGIRPSPEESDDWSVFPSYLSSKRRKLTYEKIPGVESGQTKLVFKNDLTFQNV